MKYLMVWLGLAAGGALAAPGASAFLYTVPESSRLPLLKPIQFPANTMEIALQGGALTRYDDLYEYEPHCTLLLRREYAQPHVIAPQSFRIKRVYYNEEATAALPQRVAGLGWLSDGGGGRTTYMFLTRFYLESADNPEVLYLSCKQKADYSIGEHVTRAEFAAAVGEYFSLSGQ